MLRISQLQGYRHSSCQCTQLLLQAMHRQRHLAVHTVASAQPSNQAAAGRVQLKHSLLQCAWAG